MSIIKCFSSIVLVCSPPNTSILIRFGWIRGQRSRWGLLCCTDVAARERHGSYNRINTKARAKKTRVQNQKRNLWCNTFLRMCFHFAILQKITYFPIWQHSSPHKWTYFPSTDERNCCHGNICEAGPVNLLKKKLVYAKCNKDITDSSFKPQEIRMRLTDLMSRSRSSTSKVCGFMWFKYSNCLRRAWWSTDMSVHGGGGDREKKHKCGKCTFIKRFITKQRSTLLYMANIEPPAYHCLLRGLAWP